MAGQPSPPPPKHEVKKKLAELRDAPVALVPDEVLKLLSTYLLGSLEKPTNPATFSPAYHHWYCSQADEVTKEAAVFLIRLHAYSSASVEVWRLHMKRVLSRCCYCVRGLHEAEIMSRHTYFGAFTDNILKTFYGNFHKFLTEFVVQALTEKGFSAEKDRPHGTGRTLADAPPAITFLMTTYLHMLQDTRIATLLHNYCPPAPIKAWPSDIPSSSLLALLFHQSHDIRNWAQKQSVLCEVAPIPMENFSPSHITVLKSICDSIASARPLSDCLGDEYQVPWLQDFPPVWAGFTVLLRFVPVELFRASRTFDLDIRHITVGHLHDTGNHFVDVLKSFVVILRRMGPDVWQDEDSEYPHVVFNSIKDNARFGDILCNLTSPVAKDEWLLKWLELYANSIGKLPIFKDILPSILEFLCEQLQHVRFKAVRPNAMGIASKLLFAVLAHQGKDGSARQDLALDLLTVHSAVYVNVAFGKSYADEAWEDARKQTHKLIKQALLTDVRRVASTINSLCSSNGDAAPLPAALIHKRLWKDIYDGVEGNDSDAVALLLSVIAHVAHIDDLKAIVFADTFKKSQSSTTSQAIVAAVNDALAVFRGGFRDVLSRYTDLNRAPTAIDLLKRDDVVKHVVAIMFSPVEALREGAQGIVSLAYDVDGRLDCFRALLEYFPSASFAGISEFHTTYVHYATAVPEACSLSQALARCLTDIIEGLCSSPDGLLLQPSFLVSAGEVLADKIPKWWQLMTEALCVIFAHTPRWARYFENEEMVLWMRDALIFGRDLLAQRRTLESGALARSQKEAGAASKKLSAVGKKMVDDLQQVLYELTKWLRLTDEELLHQSFALLESLLNCLQSANKRPREDTFQRIQRHIDDARKNDPNRMKSRLDSTRLLRLQEAVGAFDEDDDDIQIISHTFAPMPAKAKDRAKVKEEVKVRQEPRHILKSSTKDVKGKGKGKGGASISSYFSGADVKMTGVKPVIPSTSLRPGPVSVKKPFIKDESAKSSPAVSSTLDESSSEEESEEEEDGPKGLAGLSKLQKTPTVKKPTERRQVKMLDLPTDGKNQRLEMVRKREDARRTHMRLKPDVSGLYRALLSWNYDHDGPMPPGDRDRPRPAPVPERFQDYAHFRSIYEPMLFLEMWNQLTESKEQPLESYECRILSRQYTDEYVDLEISIDGMVAKEWSLAETDVVLLSSPNGKRRVSGKAQSYRSNHMGIHATIRYLANGGDSGLQVGTTWNLAKVLSLSTIMREYAALMALPHYDLLDSILGAQLPRPGKVDSVEVHKVMRAYNVNEPQANAILKSLDTEGFALIQGPPGTGKTSTICGLVQLYLSRRSKTIGRPGDKELPKKILLCAPSNAAIDEIAFRLKEGVSGAGHRAEHPKVVRIGSLKAMNLSVRDVSLEHLMDQKLNAHPELQNTKEAGTELARVRAELESVKVQRQQKIDEIALIHDNTAKTLALEEDMKKLNRAKAMLTHQLDKVKDKQKSDYRTLDATRRRFRNEVLQEADVICSTLSASAYEYLEPFDFEVVIIDEAAQAIELSSLIPMKYRCRTCIMVGDPQQLPPTVKSQEACRLGYDQSLFVRLQKSQPDAVHLLSIQYRMHPDISQLPSNLFYDGRLSDGPDMAEKTQRSWHSHPKFGTYRFFSVDSGTEENMPGAGHSLMNRSEAQVAVALYNRLIKEFSSTNFDFKVGVISMYRGQITELKRAFRQRFGEEVLSTVDFNTVDGFQGQEKDIIILSCVRSGPNLQTVGFLRDMRRMNVALTRAKASLFVLGNAPTLERSDDIWRKIVDNARSRSSLIKVDVEYFTAPTSYTKPPLQPTKPKAKPPSTIPPPPPLPDLLTPRELKSLANRSNAPAPITAPPGIPSKAGTVVEAPSVATSEDAQVGQKRRADVPPNDEAGGSGPAQGDSKPKPKPPLAKRQKQGPSLFIPKKRHG